MKTLYAILDIEQAINYWTRRQAADDKFALCPSASVLADVYGLMIYGHQNTVAATALTAEQARALDIALNQRELTLEA